MTSPFQVSTRARIGSMADRGDSYWQTNAAGMFPAFLLSLSFLFVIMVHGKHGARVDQSSSLVLDCSTFLDRALMMPSQQSPTWN